MEQDGSDGPGTAASSPGQEGGEPAGAAAVSTLAGRHGGCAIHRMALRDPWAVMDRAPEQVSRPGIGANVPETCTATIEKPTLQHIVDEEAILQLMKNCPMCDRKCRCSKRILGPYFIVYQSCYFCHYQRKWASQPEARNMNTYKAHAAPKRKLKLKDKVSANAQSSQLNKKSTSESSVSLKH